MTLLWVALCGGLGAGLRFVLDGVVNSLRRTSVPLGSFAVNLLGSFGLGLLTGVWAGRPGAVLALLGTGFMGGFTTFSTAMLESARLVVEQRQWAGLWLVLVMFGACLAAAAFGWSVAP